MANQGAGGAFALIHSVAWETIISALIAPVLMLIQTKFFIDILGGRDIGWSSQRRQQEQRGSFKEITTQHLGHTAAGLLLLSVTLSISWKTCLWLSPAWRGLLLAAPIVYIVSLPVADGLARKLKLFSIPE